MGVWTNIRSLWENNKALESATEALLFSFNKAREHHPERDPNAWLAWGLARRSGWALVDKEELLLVSAPCSIVPDEQAAALLGLHVVEQEYPELSRIVSEKKPELYLPVDFAVKNGSFLKRWRETNPWTDQNYPSVEQELKQGLLAGSSSKVAAKVRITCSESIELRIPGLTHGKRIRCPKCESLFMVDNWNEIQAI